MSTSAQFITAQDKDFLTYLKSRLPIFHASNVFFRDLHYGVMSYLEAHGKTANYIAAEQTTRDVISHFETQGILQPIDDRTWMVLHEEFRPTPRKIAAPAKPAPQVPAPQPAA